MNHDWMLASGLSLKGLSLSLFAITASYNSKGCMMYESIESLALYLGYSDRQVGKAHLEDPVAEYSKCFVGMQEDWRQYRQIVKGIEANAKLIMSIESILSKYIEEPFEVISCEERVHGGPVLVNCRFTSNDTQGMYRMHLDANRIVAKVEREVKKKKTTEWVEIGPL